MFREDESFVHRLQRKQLVGRCLDDQDAGPVAGAEQFENSLRVPSDAIESCCRAAAGVDDEGHVDRHGVGECTFHSLRDPVVGEFEIVRSEAGNRAASAFH